LLNNVIGGLCTLLYALFPLRVLYQKHHEHHRHVHTDKDPDYHHGNFFAWYFNFVKTYVKWWQILILATLFNILKIWFAESNLILFWVVPSLLSTLQLFLAFITCYFFGYHYEHHDSPGTPWWKLWQLK
jgi:beta-carotene ketolase (CrtW type)